MKHRVLLAVTLAAAVPAHAESVTMTGKFAAPNREVAMLRSLAVERFSGRDGAALALAVERTLGGTEHFEMVAAGARDATGIVSGAVSTGVDENPYRETETKCVERKDGKCVKEEKRQLRCTRRIVELRADVRVAATADHRVLYSAELPRRDETTWCEGEEPSRTVESVVRGMIQSVADEFRAQVTPEVKRYSVRFRESAKGLPKAMEKDFKAIVRQTQTDLTGACTAWRAMDTAVPGHPSILFDLGLCAEAAGDHARALEFYERAQPLLGRDSEAMTGAGRIRSLIAAREDDAARDGS